MRNPLQYMIRLIIKKQRTNTIEPSNLSQMEFTKNKWLYPEDNFGVLERGKAWSKD